MKLTIGLSPCPNDTFIFDALLNNKIDCEGFSFEPVLEDVETLNEWALKGKLDITKLSLPAFFQSLPTYCLLNAGSALGKAVGPLLVTKHLRKGTDLDLSNHSIALPGKHTTAHLLFNFAYPNASNKKFMLFSNIEDAVANEEVDLGVIIHENRFTYQQKGLEKVKDLGEFWEEKMNIPIPLGGIAAKRSLSASVSRAIDGLIKKSLAFSFANYPTLSNFVIENAAAMDDDVMRQHINLYVNDFSVDLGDEGKNAIHKLHTVFLKNLGQEANSNLPLFVE